MTKSTWIALGLAVLLFNIMYFGFERKSEEVLNQEKIRVNQFVQIDVNNLLLEAEAGMDEEIVAEMRLLKKETEKAPNDSLKIEKLKVLSNKWYQLGNYGIAGHYAEAIADMTNTEEAWAIAATTYSVGLINPIDTIEKDFCARKSEESYEKAISLNPTELSHRLNLAISQVEYPGENPMKGIMSLLDLNRNNPDYVPVMNTLARFAIRTGQLDKAMIRLQKAESLEPNNLKTICLLADLYKKMNSGHLALQYATRCADK